MECTKQSATDYQHDYWDEYYEVFKIRKEKNIDSFRDYHRAHNHIRKDLYIARLIKFYQEHPEKHKEYNDKRKSKNHKISKQQWEKCKSYFNNCCAYCGLPIEKHWIVYKGQNKLTDFHKEHVDDQGANDLSNCVPSCKNCNSNKWIFGLSEWYTLDNPVFSQGRLNKIQKWLNEDYKQYISKENS